MSSILSPSHSRHPPCRLSVQRILERLDMPAVEQHADGPVQQDRSENVHAAAGQLHCAMCLRPAPDYHTLAQHMKDKHGHESQARGPMSVTMSDLLQASRYG